MRPACLLLVALSAAFAACRSAPKEASKELVSAVSAANPSVASPAPAPPAAAKVEAKQFGDKIRGETVVALERVLASPSEYEKNSVVVEGKVRKACTRKGCWMELAASSDASAPGCRVTFKDYGFFVPTDSAGATARVEAAVEVASLKPRHVAHMESEGASFRNKRPDGSADEVRLVATGVELWR